MRGQSRKVVHPQSNYVVNKFYMSVLLYGSVPYRCKREEGMNAF